MLDFVEPIKGLLITKALTKYKILKRKAFLPLRAATVIAHSVL